MGYKFEKLEVWQLSLAFTDAVYEIASRLPDVEAYNLRAQMTRASNSIALNIAEGSTSQTDKEQARFVSLAIRSLIETVACFHLIHRREYLNQTTLLRNAYAESENLFKKLQAFRHHLRKNNRRIVKEDSAENYEIFNDNPFT